MKHQHTFYSYSLQPVKPISWLCQEVSHHIRLSWNVFGGGGKSLFPQAKPVMYRWREMGLYCVHLSFGNWISKGEKYVMIVFQKYHYYKFYTWRKFIRTCLICNVGNSTWMNIRMFRLCYAICLENKIVYITRVWTRVLVPPTHNTTGYWLLSLLMSQLCSITAQSSVSLKSHLQKTGRGKITSVFTVVTFTVANKRGFLGLPISSVHYTM